MNTINPPVYRLYFLGPRKEGIRLAVGTYKLCKQRGCIPSFTPKMI